jgi:hypothetical protein
MHALTRYFQLSAPCQGITALGGAFATHASHLVTSKGSTADLLCVICFLLLRKDR